VHGDLAPAIRGTPDVADATWARGRGWTLSVVLIALPYHRDTDPAITALSRRMMEQVLAER